ncbi:hypothetical protein F4779DRAFT_212729 [Xylariaceae sp. FL0662B]|nr:hypothetical protein F4779DRAFT_212729 [Xylariaceae sp. FL0662B]
MAGQPTVFVAYLCRQTLLSCHFLLSSCIVSIVHLFGAVEYSLLVSRTNVAVERTYCPSTHLPIYPSIQLSSPRLSPPPPPPPSPSACLTFGTVDSCPRVWIALLLIRDLYLFHGIES